jgi:hypothetical protein
LPSHSDCNAGPKVNHYLAVTHLAIGPVMHHWYDPRFPHKMIFTQIPLFLQNMASSLNFNDGVLNSSIENPQDEWNPEP